jgi:hypothetical protein
MLLRPVDPATLDSMVFQMFDRQHHEPNWSRWVANRVLATTVLK